MEYTSEQVKSILKRTNISEEIKSLEKQLQDMKILEQLERLGCDLELFFTDHNRDIYKALVHAGYEKEAVMMSELLNKMNSK